MNKKTLGGFLAGLAGIAAAIIAAKQPQHRTPPAPPIDYTVPVYTLTVHVCKGDCLADHKIPGAAVTLDHGAIGVVTDGAGNAGFLNVTAGRYTVCATADGYKEFCIDHGVPADGEAYLGLEADVPPIGVLSADGKIFRENGQPFRWKGVSAFALLDRYAKGEDIQPFLDAYRGYNLLRVWPYVPAKDWGAKAWDSPSPDVVVSFLAYVAQRGWHVELTALTDDDPARLAWAKGWISAVSEGHPNGLVWEAGNEPTTHKAIDTHALRWVLDATGLLYSSGDYEDSARWYGSFLTAHTGRDSDWPRRSHDLLEFFQGGGPNAPTDPAHRVPIVSDEPIRPDQAGYNAADFRAYAAACALLGAGLSYHTETGKYGLPPTPEEARIAAVVLDALNAFPADAPTGSYRRIDEGGRSLRTYVIGERYMVRIRPTTTAAPESGWTALDAEGILWRR